MAIGSAGCKVWQISALNQGEIAQRRIMEQAGWAVTARFYYGLESIRRDLARQGIDKKATTEKIPRPSGKNRAPFHKEGAPESIIFYQMQPKILGKLRQSGTQIRPGPALCNERL
jgi:hypothetical protein